MGKLYNWFAEPLADMNPSCKQHSCSGFHSSMFLQKWESMLKIHENILQLLLEHTSIFSDLLTGWTNWQWALFHSCCSQLGSCAALRASLAGSLHSLSPVSSSGTRLASTLHSQLHSRAAFITTFLKNKVMKLDKLKNSSPDILRIYNRVYPTSSETASVVRVVLPKPQSKHLKLPSSGW